MGKLELNKKHKQESLLNTAFDLFTTKGIAKTTVSDITDRAGVAKGTFYLYFKDKFDLRNRLITHKSGILFENACKALNEQGGSLPDAESKIIFIADCIIDQLTEDKLLLGFIAKNLSWSVFKNALQLPGDAAESDYRTVLAEIIKAEPDIKQAEIMLFLIVELVSSSCYSSILFNEPVPIDELKPYIFRSVRAIIGSHRQ